jgi:murein DD-endopeptidase MepM/ murein hydrolase activator NlpD
MHNIILFTFLATLLVGCASQEPAPIEFNQARVDAESSGNVGHTTEEEIILKPQANSHEYNSATGYLNEKRPEEPLVIPGSPQDNAKIIYHEVQAGETVETVAKNYDSTTEDIIKLNDLTPPFKLDEFQIIKIKVSSDVLNKRNRETTVVPTDSHAMYPEASMLNIVKPVEGKIITAFGKPLKTGKSNGVNISAAAGTSVKSVASGVVIKSGNSVRYGNLVIVKLDGANISVAYAHLKDMILKPGQKVAQGEIIGHVGSTGEVSAPQLHFAIKEGDIAVDPLKYIPDLGSN